MRILLLDLFERDGVYYADGRCNTPTTGKHSLGTRTYDEALKNLRKLDRQIALLRKVVAEALVQSPQKVSIADGWKLYKCYCTRPAALGGVSVGTQKRYRAVQDKHIAYCLEKRVENWNQIDKKCIEEYGRWLDSKEYSAASIYLECSTLKQVVKWMIEEENLLPPTNRIRLKLPRSTESSTYCYTRVQVEAILAHCKRVNLSWMETVISALATTGMRIGELIQLRWSDIDLRAWTISVPDNRHSARQRGLGAIRTTKGRSTRRFPVHALLRAELEKLAHHESGRVFVGPKGGVLKADSLRVILVEQILQPLKSQFPTPSGEIGFEHGRLHSFRHYFVSQAYLGGASEGEIREWVGHSNSRIVERYRHLRSDEARRKMDAIDFFTLSRDILK